MLSLRDTDCDATLRGAQAMADTAVRPVAALRSGTLIRTPCGEVPVEALRIGSRVLTLDHGPQRLRWIGLVPAEAAAALAPVRVPSGLLDNRAELVLSASTRVVLRSARAELHFGTNEVLVPVTSLGDAALAADRAAPFHLLLFDRHEVIWAQDAMVESLPLTERTLAALPGDGRSEIALLAPDLLRPAPDGRMLQSVVRPSLAPAEAAVIVDHE